MLPNNFARLANAEPQLRSAFEKLAKWAQSHQDWKWIDPGIVAKDIPEVDEFSLADALDRAVRHGYLVIKYTVVTPSGGLAHHAFDSPREIPRRMPDRFEEYFDTTESPIVAVFEDTGDEGSHLPAEGDQSPEDLRPGDTQKPKPLHIARSKPISPRSTTWSSGSEEN